MKRIIIQCRLIYLCIIGLLAGNTLNAQIIYQDIAPDLQGAGIQQTISGVVFQFTNGSLSPNSGTADALAMITGNADDIAILDEGAMIGPDGFWNIDAWINATGTVTYTDKYIGFRIPVAGGYQYGWFNIDVTYTNPGAGATWTVKSYGYQQTLNTAIAAGDQGDDNGGGNDGGGDDGNIQVSAISVTGLYGVSSITSNGGTLQMMATIIPANASNHNIFWSVEDGTGSASISTTGLLTAISDGSVIVKAHAMDGSGTTGQAMVYIYNQATAIADLNKLGGLCYPNPVKNELFLRFDKNETVRYISIYNLAGLQVYKNTVEQTGDLITIPTNSLPAGTYTLIFENAAGKTGVQNVIKQ